MIAETSFFLLLQLVTLPSIEREIPVSVEVDFLVGKNYKQENQLLQILTPFFRSEYPWEEIIIIKSCLWM